MKWLKEKSKKDYKQVEKKVEEKIEEMVVDKVEHGDDSSGELSRRDFLKKLGTGAAGFGALAMIPGSSAFNIRTSNPLNYYGDNQTNPNFSVQPDGTLQAQSVKVDEVTISSTGPIKEVGTVDAGKLDPGTTSNISVTFSNTYSSVPHVITAVGGTYSHETMSYLQSAAANISTTGFDFIVRNDVDNPGTEDARKSAYLVIAP